MAQQNIAVKLCGILQAESDKEITAQEWRLLGQEQDGSQLLSWAAIDTHDKEVLHIGVYTNKTRSLSTLYTFNEKLNIIQASVNASRSLLVYVVKELLADSNEIKQPLYHPFSVCLLPDHKEGPVLVEQPSSKQIFQQYVYGKSNKYSPGIRNDRFILLKHLEYIKIYRTPLFLNECADGTERWGFDGIYPEPETVVEVFTWAQWDCELQSLYYIHYRPGPGARDEEPRGEGAGGAGDAEGARGAATLSALQFHADLPHETVLNIPLNLPHVGDAGGEAACGEYEDDPLPLRVHDCSIDLQLVCDARGLVAVCHHYLYKSLDESTSSSAAEGGLAEGGAGEGDVVEEAGDADERVNVAVSVTVLHAALALHAVLPAVPWRQARALRPAYVLLDEQLVVLVPPLYTHVLDVSGAHDAGAQFLLPAPNAPAPPARRCLAALRGWGPGALVDLATLDVVVAALGARELLVGARAACPAGRLAVLHHLLLHADAAAAAEELVTWALRHVAAAGGALPVRRLMQEFLVAHAAASTRRGAAPGAGAVLPVGAGQLVSDSLRAGGVTLRLRRAASGAAGVLAPRQRVAQFAEDAWTRVWARLAARPAPKLALGDVRARLNATADSYRPEALSRCSTPLSPGGAGWGGAGWGAGAARRDDLPFVEHDVCTASRHEHVVAANLREVSVHLMREAAGAGAGGGSGAEGVHALATRWAAAQGEASRALCRAAVRAAVPVPPDARRRGDAYIEALSGRCARALLWSLEQYLAAVEGAAWPGVPGAASFVARLAWRALPPPAFMLRLHRHALDLHIDALKSIVASYDEAEGGAGLRRRLRVLAAAGGARGRRCLALLPPAAGLPLRARDHAATLLSGAATAARRDPAAGSGGGEGAALWALDSLLELLTAKASLADLDFNLIIDATRLSLAAR